MEALDKLEAYLAGIFRETPMLTKENKESLVGVWPLVAILFGVLQLLAVVELWHLGHRVDQVANALRSLSYGDRVIVHLNTFYWLSLVTAAVEGLMLLAAYPALQKRRKTGWNLLFYATLINLVYGIFSSLNNYGGVTSLLLQILVSTVVLYFLFQVRELYHGGKTAKR